MGLEKHSCRELSTILMHVQGHTCIKGHIEELTEGSMAVVHV